MIPENYGTYQNFVTSPGYFNVDWPGGLHKLRRQLLKEFIAVSHPQRIQQARHFCQNWQLRVNNTSFIGDQVLHKRMLTVTHHKGTLLDLPPLPRQLVLVQWISVEIQHTPPRCFQTKALITGKLMTALEVPQHFMMPECEHGDILSTYPTEKWLSKLSAPDPPVTKNLSSSVAGYTFFLRKVFLDRIFRRLCWCLSHLRWFPTSQLSVDFAMALASALFSSVNVKKDIVHQIRKLLNQIEAGDTNYSSRETAVVLSPPRKRSYTGTPSEDQWHESQWQQVR